MEIGLDKRYFKVERRGELWKIDTSSKKKIKIHKYATVQEEITGME